MTSLDTASLFSVARLKTRLNRENLSEFIPSSFVFQSVSIIVMVLAFIYGMSIDSRKIIVFSAFNGIASILLFGLVLWMTKIKTLPDRYYSWSTAINYVGAVFSIPYLIFIDYEAVLAFSTIFFFINIFNLCVLLHILNFRSNHHHSWNALRQVTESKKGFKFKLTMGLRLHMIMPIGLISIHFESITINHVEHDLYYLTKHFKEYGLDLSSVTDDDLKLWEMINY
jgi:hypothetical protein